MRTGGAMSWLESNARSYLVNVMVIIALIVVGVIVAIFAIYAGFYTFKKNDEVETAKNKRIIVDTLWSEWKTPQERQRVARMMLSLSRITIEKDGTDTPVHLTSATSQVLDEVIAHPETPPTVPTLRDDAKYGTYLFQYLLPAGWTIFSWATCTLMWRANRGWMHDLNLRRLSTWLAVGIMAPAVPLQLASLFFRSTGCVREISWTNETAVNIVDRYDLKYDPGIAAQALRRFLTDRKPLALSDEALEAWMHKELNAIDSVVSANGTVEHEKVVFSVLLFGVSMQKGLVAVRVECQLESRMKTFSFIPLEGCDPAHFTAEPYRSVIEESFAAGRIFEMLQGVEKALKLHLGITPGGDWAGDYSKQKLTKLLLAGLGLE